MAYDSVYLNDVECELATDSDDRTVFFCDDIRHALNRGDYFTNSLSKRPGFLGSARHHLRPPASSAGNRARHAVKTITQDHLRIYLAETVRAGFDTDAYERTRRDFALFDAGLEPLDLSISGSELIEVAHPGDSASLLWEAQSVQLALSKSPQWLSARLSRVDDQEKIQIPRPYSDDAYQFWYLTASGLGQLLSDSNGYKGDAALLHARLELADQLKNQLREAAIATAANAEAQACQALNLLGGTIDISLQPRILPAGARFVADKFTKTAEFKNAQATLWDPPLQALFDNISATYHDPLTPRGPAEKTRVLSIPASLIGKKLSDGRDITYSYLCDRFGVSRTSVHNAAVYAKAFGVAGPAPTLAKIKRTRFMGELPFTAVKDSIVDFWMRPEFVTPSSFGTMVVRDAVCLPMSFFLVSPTLATFLLVGF